MKDLKNLFYARSYSLTYDPLKEYDWELDIAPALRAVGLNEKEIEFLFLTFLKDIAEISDRHIQKIFGIKSKITVRTRRTRIFEKLRNPDIIKKLMQLLDYTPARTDL